MMDWGSVETRDKNQREKNMERKTVEEENMDEHQSTNEERTDAEHRKVDVTRMDKICPICSETFTTDVNFYIFQNHVEAHFIDDETIAQPFEVL